ncbi:MAG: DUF2220 domain-containing protein [Clostridiales bacterium]|nr:DUF2220 domain-containing protein [Clostridiales bacterium]
MSEKTQKLILDSLLDKYERSSFFRDATQPTRRIMLNFYNGGRSDFAYYDIEQSERRIDVNGSVEDLAAAGLLSFEWMKGEHQHIIAKAWLNLDNLRSAYLAAGREPKADATEKILSEIEAAQSNATAPWAKRFLQDAYGETTRKRSISSAIPADSEDRRLLFKAIASIDEPGGTEYTERVFSLRTFGDTKLFERTVRSKLLSILRKYLESDDDAADSDLLKQVGIVKFPEQFEFCGNISLAFDQGTVNFGFLPGGASIRSFDLSAGLLSVGGSVETITTIENYTNYLEYIRKSKAENELVIYHGGQISPRKLLFLRAVANAMPANCMWRHWSDIDYGGFLMLSRLRREVVEAAAPYRMDAGELIRYGSLAAPIKPRYAEKLRGLKARPELADCCDCIDYMLKNMVRLEQEAMLADNIALDTQR